MRTPLWTIVMVLLLAASLAASSSPFQVGRPFPVRLLPSLERGRPLSVADFRGRRLMLHIWASW